MQRRLLLFSLGAAGLLSTGAALVWRQVGVRPVAVPEDDVCIVAPTFAYDPSSGLPPHAAREVPPQARCPVCGMFPARSRQWAAQVIFSDAEVQYLDSPLSLFHYLQRIERYTPGRRLSDAVAIYVSDLNSGQWLPADQAVYVHGSSMPGPMRSGNLPAFDSEPAARNFISRHGGQLLTAASLRQALPADLQQLAPHVHDAPH